MFWLNCEGSVKFANGQDDCWDKAQRVLRINPWKSSFNSLHWSAFNEGRFLLVAKYMCIVIECYKTKLFPFFCAILNLSNAAQSPKTNTIDC